MGGLALALALAAPLAACGEKAPKVIARERDDFTTRCTDLCKSSGFDNARVKELEIVGETVTRECYCTLRGEETPKPYLMEKGLR